MLTLYHGTDSARVFQHGSVSRRINKKQKKPEQIDLHGSSRGIVIRNAGIQQMRSRKF